MRRTMMHAKIHRAVVTDCHVDYPGSLTVDPDYLESVGILEHERVQVVDVDNGARFETYAIAGEAGSGAMVVNGGAALLVSRGDRVIVIAYAEMEEDEARRLVPKVLVLDGANASLAGT
jgi:aspartate 1-decarboxylase